MAENAPSPHSFDPREAADSLIGVLDCAVRESAFRVDHEFCLGAGPLHRPVDATVADARTRLQRVLYLFSDDSFPLPPPAARVTTKQHVLIEAENILTNRIEVVSWLLTRHRDELDALLRKDLRTRLPRMLLSTMSLRLSLLSEYAMLDRASEKFAEWSYRLDHNPFIADEVPLYRYHAYRYHVAHLERDQVRFWRRRTSN